MSSEGAKKNRSQKIEIDASGKVLGRLATEVTTILRGKNKVGWRPYLDEGPQVVVYNLEKIKVTGKKPEKKIYWHHSNYPGGIKSIKYKDLFKKDPSKVFYKAVYGMLPKNRLRMRMLRRLELYKSHPN